MPNRLLALLILFFVSIKTYAIEFPIEIIEYFDDIKVVAFINESDIDKSLDWPSTDAALPLSISGALKAVRVYMSTDPTMEQGRLASIELKQIPHHENYWHYVVRMKTRENGRSKSHYFIVLMNGKVIPALKEPESFK